MFAGFSDLRKNEETLNAGNKWLPEEDEKLIQEITNKISFEDIALEHKRTITAIKSRVISHILYTQYKNENKTIDDLSVEYNIEKYLIEKYINKLDTNNSIKKSVDKNKQDNKQKDNNIKLKINEKLLLDKIHTIEQKLDFIISIISK